MQALFLRRNISRIKNIQRVVKQAALSLVFLFVVFGNIVPAFAQTIYEDYANLFNGPNPKPALTILSKVTPIAGSTTGVKPDFKFQFIGSFDPQKGYTSLATSEFAKWHWNHVFNFNGLVFRNEHVFVLRICNSSDTNEDNCYFSDVPYKTKITGNGNWCENNVCRDLNTSKEPLPYIYSLNSNDDFFDKFNVAFSVPTLATLKDGGLNSPINIGQTFKISDQSEYKASIWYCATQFENNLLPTDEPNDNIRQFKNLCGGDRPYFKIAETIFKMPQTLPEALNQTVATTTQVDVSPNVDEELPSCSFTNGLLSSGSIVGCLAQGIYYVIYWPIAWFAGLMGTIFDFFLGYSLNDTSYRAEFAVKGWQLVRDISNIFFIIILVWTGLSTALTGKSNMKQVVPQLILNALLINFSLFGTRVIIDFSNVVARVFYNQVHVCKGDCTKSSDGKIDNLLTGPGGYMSLSTKIVSSFKPQIIFNSSVLAKDAQVGGAQLTKKLKATDSDTAGYFIIVTIIAALIMFGIAMMFWNVAFMFLGRVVGLYMVMIFAPFAVLTAGGMPLVGSFQELSWKKWLSDLTNYALLAPIFVFFLYIIYSFLDSGFLEVISPNGENNFFANVISVAIPMLIVYFMMKQGVGIAKKYAGQFGNGLQDFVNKTVGGVGGLVGGGIGLAAGGAALLGRGTAAVIGQGAKKWGWNTWAAKNAEDSWFARKTNSALKNIQTSTWDVRNAGIKIGKKEYTAGATLDKGFGLMGAKPSYGFSDALGLSQKGYVGGNLKIQKDRDKKRVEEIEKQLNFDHLSEAEAKEAWKQKMENSIQKASEKNWENNITKAEEVAKNSQAYRNLQQKEKDLEADLARSKASGSIAGQTVAEQALAQNKIAQANTMQQVKDLETTKPEEFQKMRLQTIEDLKKNSNYRNSTAYTTAGEIEKKRLVEDYGTIKDVKTLTSAMRSEYAKGLREKSFWMKDGQPRWGISSAGGMGTTGILGVGGAFNTVIDAGIGLIVGAHIKELQNSFDRASKTVSDKHKKTVTGTTLAKHQETLDTLNKKLKKELEANNFLEDIEKATAKHIEDAIIAGIARRNKIIKEFEKKEKGGGVLTTDEENTLARNQKELSDLKRMETERANIKDKIEAIQNKAKDDEEKKKKGDDKPDKPKDEAKK